MLQSLSSFLGYPSCFLGLLQLWLQLQDQLFLCGQLYFSMIELFVLVLNLVLGILLTSLSILPCPLLRDQLGVKLLVLLLGSSQGPVGLGAKVGLNLDFISSILDPFLRHKNLLDSLHINKRGSR